MSVTADTVINAVRDLIPDPVYDSAGNPLPASDGGLFRSQTLLRWLSDGVKALAGQTGWVIEDWTAAPLWNKQPWYALDPKFHGITECFVYGFRMVLATEGLTIWPNPVVAKQPVWYTVHRQSDHLEIAFFPVPSTTDVTTFLTSSIGATDTLIAVGDVAGFAPVGYVLIDNELISYRSVTPGNIGVVSRGQGGTKAATHASSAVVSYCSAWFKGPRLPTDIAAVTDPVELPTGFIYAVQEYLLSKCAYGQNDEQAGKLHMNEFRAEAKRLQQDPSWRTDAQGVQVRPYGYATMGRLAWGNVIIP